MARDVPPSHFAGGDTNTQVEGVAEADIVKTDGTTVYALRGQTLRVVASAAGGAGGAETGVLTFDTYPSEMLLRRGRLVVISSTCGDALLPGSIPARPNEPHQGPLTLVYTVDVRDGQSPRLLSTTRLQGSYVSSRSVGGVVRLVLASEPPARLPFTAPGERSRPGRFVPRLSEAQAEAANKAMVAATTLGDWFPRFRTIPGEGVRGGITSGYVATCARTFRPAAFAGYSLLLILTLPLAADAPSTSLGRGTAIFAGGQTVYSSIGKISALRRAGGADAATPPTPLERVGGVGDLGRGERIYTVRYIGAIAYVVTFRQVDPLYVISLAVPTAPVATWELKIPGFSSYLHPLGDGLLLGVGQDATPTGRTTGVKVSLFDVSDVRAPREVATWAEPDFASSSNVQWDHRAFLYWAPTRLAVLPVTSFGRGAFIGSVVLSLGETTITEAGRITHPPWGHEGERRRGDGRGERIDRNLVLGRQWLWSLSNSRF
ncbi:hypothetical protein I4F81_012879 [Pyropia yezoensis]|uniref:Uncharacterized protein n=1 Tax=Pyropia yezoensis TaxID=2788 RepID=A0ACC3CJQ8_PYRYE|nr:hypothetical protein I4F81_012879 [Neopyropia yezoensis]